MSDTLEPVEIDPRDRNLMEKIGRLRVDAWAAFHPSVASTVCFLDDFELIARHWCIFQGGEPIASARMSIHKQLHELPDAFLFEDLPISPPSPLASFNRLVVHPRFRKNGLSRGLDEIRLTVAKDSGCQSALIETHSGTARMT